MECKICGNKDDLKEYRIKEVMFGTNESFLYYECGDCGCLQISDIPNNIDQYYPEQYYSFNKSSHYAKTRFNEILKERRDRFVVFKKGILGRFIDKIKPNIDPHLRALSHIHISKRSQILDVGCGRGQFLLSLKRIGFEDLVGIDPYLENDIKYDNGLCVYRKSIFNFQEKKDIIMFHHSFEHIPEQLDTLHAVKRLLNDNGYCIIRVPTVSSYAWKHYRENWVQLDAPRHFFLHSLKSMQVLARQASLCVERVIYDSTSLQFLGSEKILKGFTLNDGYSYSTIFSRKEIRTYKMKAIELNKLGEGDACVFILRKRNDVHMSSQ